MGTNSGLSIEAKSGQHEMKDGAEAEPLVEAEAKEPCNDIEMLPHAATEAANDGANASELYTSLNVIDGVLDEMEMKCTADGVTNNTEQQPQLERHVKDAADATESKSFAEIQLKEAVDHAELELCTGPCAKEVLSGAVLEPYSGEQKNEVSEENCSENLAKDAQNDAEVEPNEVQVLNASEIEPCGVNHATKLFDNGNFDQFSNSNEVKEVNNDIDLETCHKDQVKEPTNDDMHSEVSNPNLSPKHVTSSLTISSQPIDVLGSERGGCGEITSICSWDSVVDGSFCEEEQSKCKLGSVSTACVVLEIPKHIRPTGIRKITFKFSKRKQDCDTGLSVSAKPLADDKIHKDFHDNKLSLPADESLANNGFPMHERNALENAKLNTSVDGGECQDTRSPSSCVPNMEMKMSKKIILDNYPTNVKKLLSTGILEGARVKYITLSGEKELPGIIKGCGYLCGCCNCSFSKVLSAYEFEVHAGSKSRHPNNHIYLENGKPIYSIVEELKSAPLSKIDDAIRSVAGSSVNEVYLQAWKASLQHSHAVAYTDNEHQSKHLGTYHFPTSDTSHYTGHSSYPNLYQYPHMTSFNPQGYIEVPVEQKRPIKKPRHNSSSCWEHKKTAEGGNKKRDNDLHKLLFLPNGLPDGTTLAYYSKGKRILGGYKQGNGIVCSCCNCEISPSQFESHAGWAAKRQPYRNIYTSSGLTLHDIALMLASGQHLPSSASDDMCAVCGDGGELIICNGCPRVFHAGCLGLHCLPDNDWHCPHCKDKFGPGRKAVGETRPIIIRLKRVVKAPEFEPGGCVICRSQDFSAAKFDDRTVIICDQCEKEYHVGCLRESELCDLKELPEDKWFCCNECNKIFEALQNLGCSGPEVIPAAASAAVYKKQATIGLNDSPIDEIQWCILSGKSRFPEHLVLLSRAAAIFRERFDPIVAKSGRDIIPVMVYGRNISGQEFSGMHCVVLLVKSVVVSAALLRIFGRDVAELPLVATNRENQGKGYFQALFCCIESFLSSLSVKHLVLPAAVEAEPMWTNKLGFRKTTNEQMLKYTRDFQLTIFKGTSLLEKDVQQ